MVKPLVKTGNSLALVINKDMLSHLALDGDEVEILETPRGYIVQKPRLRLTVEEAASRAFERYDEVFKELAK